MNSGYIKTRVASLALMLCAGGLVLASLRLPLWHMRMEAPQYKDDEALQVHVYAREMRGDLGEISVLNQYIGAHVPKDLPQFRWLPIALATGALVGLAGVFLPVVVRRRVMVAAPAMLCAAVLLAAGQAQWQMYEFGHRRDQKTKLVGVKDFTPLLLGKVKIAQFEVTSRLGAGAYLIGVAVVLQAAAARLNRRRKQEIARPIAQVSITLHPAHGDARPPEEMRKKQSQGVAA